MNALDKKLLETEPLRLNNWIKLVAVLKHQFGEWAMAKLAAEGFNDFKMVYMPVLMNIRAEGTNNNELASQARVTKQAMSKVAKELQALGYIKSKADASDKRITIFTLTDRGKKLVINARLRVCDLTEEYRKLFKASDFDRATEIMKSVIAYNDKMLLPKK